MRALLLALALLVPAALSGPAFAVQPDEMLDDPALEARAREISAGLRCLVCRNESIDDSNAEFSRTLRLLVRERLLEGDTNPEVVDYIVDRYGEYVLLQPSFTVGNALIWLSGPLLFALGGWTAWRYVSARERAVKAAPAPLSAEEERRLAALLRDPKDAGA
jgi:cytochrome c-type biogenesis protein CcmH